MNDLANRRPLKSRDTGWARQAARLLARLGASPDMISAASVIFAAVGGVLLGLSDGADASVRPLVLIAAAACVQLRLLCNLLDGMVAVEHGKGGPHGPIWNELPDRLSDVFLLIGAGYGAGDAFLAYGATLGWAAAVLAVLTAYVRELGRGLGLEADFCGPMAKPHRMAVLTLASLMAAVEGLWGWRGESLLIGLAIIVLGAAITVARRTARLGARLRARG